MTESWNPKSLDVIDIGGSKMGLSLDKQLALAFANKASFPKELNYTDCMEEWFACAGVSYQTTHEMQIIKETAHAVIADMPSGTCLVDLGCADSDKFIGYIEAFRAQGKTCIYVPLDINLESLRAQVQRAKAKFGTIECVGLWGDFDDGDAFFAKIPSAKLFLSLGSIFFNAPDKLADERSTTFKDHLSPNDRLVVGQDGPSSAERANAHAAYNTPQYDAMITQYLRAIMKRAGIKNVQQHEDPRQAWGVESFSIQSKHYFQLTAKIKMLCTKFDGLVIPVGAKYEIFPSWKRDEVEIGKIAQANGLAIRTLGSKGSFHQFLLKQPTN